jgi:hypothetical protein
MDYTAFNGTCRMMNGAFEKIWKDDDVFYWRYYSGV